VAARYSWTRAPSAGGTPPRLGVKVAKFVWDVWKIKIG
jgi:hypothetical protein